MCSIFYFIYFCIKYKNKFQICACSFFAVEALRTTPLRTSVDSSRNISDLNSTRKGDTGFKSEETHGTVNYLENLATAGRPASTTSNFRFKEEQNYTELESKEKY